MQIPVTDGTRTSIGLRKVAVKSTPPQVIVSVVLVGVNFKGPGIHQCSASSETQATGRYVQSYLFESPRFYAVGPPSKSSIGCPP